MLRFAHRVVLLLGFLFPSFGVLALPVDRAISQYAHRAWRIEEGLPNSVVRGVTQTEDGSLWIGTYDGMARFDGDEFELFNRTNLPKLRRDTVLALLKSRDGALWLGTNGGGAARWKGSLDLLTKRDGLPSDIVTCFAEGGDGTLWVGTSEGLAEVRGGKVRRTFGRAEGLSNVSLLSLALSADGTLWIGTRGGGLFSLRKGTIHSEGLGGDSVPALYVDAKDTLWVGAGTGLMRRDGDSLTAIPAVPVDQVTALFRDSDGTLWVGTYGSGLYRSGDGVTFSSFTRQQGLLNNSVRSIFEDREKTIWVGTNGGLESFHAGRFITIGEPEGLSDPYARSVFEDRDGNIWIGTARGLNLFSSSEHKVFTARDGLANDHIFAVAQTADAMWFGTQTGLSRYAGGKFTTFTDRDGLPSQSARALLVDRSGTLWVGTDRGIARLEGDRFVKDLPAPQWDGAFVQALAQSSDGSVWIGADGKGIARYRDGVFTAWNESQGLPDSHVLSLLVDTHGILWIGTDSGGMIRLENGRFTQYTTATGLPTDKVLQILDDGQGRIWAGGGLGIWYVEQRLLSAFAERRVARVNARLFDAGDGMRSVQCNGSVSPSGIRSRDGRLWFPTVNGVATIDSTRSLALSLGPPPVQVARVVVDNHPVPFTTGLEVPPGTRQIEIHYAALTFVSPERARFRYKLEGYDKDWVDAGNRRVAYYTGVPPDHYTFRVIAANADGIWNLSGASLGLNVRPRFIETLWFPILILIGLAALAGFLYQRRMHRVRRREAELITMVELRTRDIHDALRQAEEARRIAEEQEGQLANALVEAEAANRAKSTFLANMSHELRTPLNAIIGFAGVLEQRATRSDERQLKFIQNIGSSGEHLLALINDLLDLAKIEAGKMTLEVEAISVRELIESVALTARGMAMSRGIEVQVRVAPDLQTLEADPIKVREIIYNLLSNAVKFSPDNALVILVAGRLVAADSPLSRDSVTISVIDHGSGIAPDEQEVIFEEFKQLYRPVQRIRSGTGLGLTLVRKFVELHRGIVEVTSEPGKGSTFTVTLPERHSEGAAEPVSPGRETPDDVGAQPARA